MKTLFIDVRHSFSVSKESGKFNGGNNYSKRVIKLIAENAETDISIILICVAETIEYIKKELEDNEKIKYLAVNDISKIDAKAYDVYYTPQLDDSLAYKNELKRFRRKNPNTRIYITLHDRRHKFISFDKYDGLLKNGIKSNPFLLIVGRYLNSLLKENSVKYSVSVADKIFTVSNYSMQSILNYKRIKYINWFYQGIYNYNEKSEQCEDFALFVSAGRPEKNFIRALLAFEMYVKKSGDKTIKLKCVGISKELKSKLKSKLRLDDEICDNQVIFYGYVPQDELDHLYANCRFLLFVSKSEGFGLPVLEAALKCKPVISSNRTSIPEVIGAAGVYVDPYNIHSICNGIELLMDNNIYREQVSFMSEKKEILKQQIELDSKIFIREILR